MYFLKPFDAVNDTLTASLIYRLGWDGEFIEIGSGDGMYSYVMHGGKFPLWFDRYHATDLDRQDIYDCHQKGVLETSKELSEPDLLLSIDAKESHVRKINEIGFSKYSVVSNYERLPTGNERAENIFFYTPHGLLSHEAAIADAWRILKQNGRMLILVYDHKIERDFICYRLGKILSGKIGDYFRALDNGRRDEILQMSRSEEDWKALFVKSGFRVNRINRGLSGFAWRVYDIQTRPFLKWMIKGVNSTPGILRTPVKVIWMALWFPILLLFYLLFSNEYISLGGRGCYAGYELIKE